VISKRPYAIVTDASMDKLGLVSFFRNEDNRWVIHREQTLHRSHATSIEEEEWALTFLKEDLLLYRPDAIICGIDNMGVSRSLLRGVSASPKTDFFVQQAIDAMLLHISPHKIALLDIKSSDNVADVLTRSEDTGSEDYSTRRRLTLKALDRALDNINHDVRWTSRLIPEGAARGMD
jgi:hypothetical protein